MGTLLEGLQFFHLLRSGLEPSGGSLVYSQASCLKSAARDGTVTLTSGNSADGPADLRDLGFDFLIRGIR